MTNNENFIKAFYFASDKHKNQKIPGSDLPYITHISNVCFELLLIPNLNIYNIEFLLIVACLHDTIEDTETSPEEILKIFGNDVKNAVIALSKDYKLPKKIQLEDSIERILNQPLEVQIVKLADRISNLYPPPKTWSKEKIINYHQKSIILYEKLKNANTFLSEKLLNKIKNYTKYF